METGLDLGVPDFGAVIPREHLLGVFKAHRPALALVCAPGGYGKSVLASQLAEAGGFEAVLWVSGLDEDMLDDRLLRSVASALPSSVVTSQDSTAAHPLSRTDALLTIGDGLKRYSSKRLCLVLDGCSRIESVSSLQDLAVLVRRLTVPSSSLVVTCRRVAGETGPINSCTAWVVEEQDLRFTEEEILRLQSLIDSAGDRAPGAALLLARFGGHPALTSLMLRHEGLDETTTPPRDLMWYADRLADTLSRDALRLLYVSSLLQEDAVCNIASCMPESIDPSVWEEMEALSPLMLMNDGPSLEGRVRVHAVLRDAARRRASGVLGDAQASALRRTVLRHLSSRESHARVLNLLHVDCEELEVAEWLTECGSALLRHVGHEAVLLAMRRISPALLSGNPHLLLLRASILREQEQYEESRVNALLAAELADALGDEQLRDSCVLLVAWLGVDSSRPDVVRQALRQLESGRRAHLHADSERLISLCTAIMGIQNGNTRDVASRIDNALASLESADRLVSDDALRSVNALAGLTGVHCGNWSTAARLMTILVNRPDLSPSRRILIRANLAVCHMELGSLREAKSLLDEVIADTEAAGLQHLAAHAFGTRSSVNYGRGDAHNGLLDFERCNQLMGALEHEDVRLAELLNAAVNRRAVGLCEEALALVEQAELITRHGATIYLISCDLVSIEASASLLSLGDVWSARRRVRDVRCQLEGSGAIGYLYRADLVLAEADRIEGDIETAVSRLAEYAEYIDTGSANWLSAMYIRAFPGLLGLLGKAMGVDKLPLRMLLMVPPETLNRAICDAPYLSEQEVEVLKRRRGSEPQVRAEAEATASDAAPPRSFSCHVRLFGGLEVSTEAGSVDEDDWRKRKARLLFLILVLKQHQDVPRDVLLERLWPDMDEEHAKRNFYVTWSTMKRALACGGAPSDAKQLVQCTGGVCRATRQVRSDLDDFDDALTSLRASAVASDLEGVLGAARQLIGIYRGELLPGDLYEEWFAEVRERIKHDFCDAMMTAANVAESHADSEAALLFLRKASAADPWREDVYQSMMRCQMNAGQRSRAIETYLSCRSRLTEDLGIDPSIETTRIYQAVLAMEDAGSPER